MRYVIFSLWFIFIHTASYIFAGAIALKISNNLYEEKERIIDYVRDMSDENERKHVEKWFIPAQIIRGLLLSLVLYPLVESKFPLALCIFQWANDIVHRCCWRYTLSS